MRHGFVLTPLLGQALQLARARLSERAAWRWMMCHPRPSLLEIPLAFFGDERSYLSDLYNPGHCRRPGEG